MSWVWQPTAEAAVLQAAGAVTFTVSVVGAGSVSANVKSTPLLAPSVAGAGVVAVTLTTPGGATPTFRAKSDNGNASGGALTVTKPTGTVDGDLIVVHAYLESDTNTWASVGSGFTSITSGTNTGAFSMQAWWKIASGEPASWTWTPTTTGVWRIVTVASYSGFSGSAVDIAGTTGQGDGVTPSTNQTAPSITTVTDGDLVVFCYGNFGGGAPTAMAGFCTNLRTGFGGCTIADAVQTTHAATGTSRPSSGPGTQDYAAFHYAMTPSSGVAAVNFAPTIAGAGSVSATVSSTPLFTPSVAGAGSVTAIVKSTPLFSPAIVGAAAITANVSSVPFLAPSIIGAGSVAATVASTPRFVPAVVGAGTVSVSLTSPALLAPSVVAASTVTVAFTVHSAITRDTWVSNANPTFNYGAATSVASAGVGSATPANIILRLDLTPYQAGGTIGAGGASLTLYVASSTAAARDWDAYPLQAANAGWTEGTGSGSATGDGATWNTKDGTNAWAGGANGAGVAGTDYDNTVALFTTALHYAISDPADTALTATFSAAGITALQAALGSTLDIILIRQGASTVTGPGLRSHETASPNKPLFFIDYVAPALIPSIVVVSTVAATVSSTPLLTPSVAGAGVIAATLTSPALLTPAVAGAGSVAATVKSTPLLAPVIAGAGVVAASVSSTPLLSPAVAVAGAISATVSSTPLLTPVVAGAGVVAVALTSPALLAASVAGAGAIAASLTSPALLSPAVAGAGVVSATVASTPFLSPTVAGAGVVAAMVKSTPLLSPVVTGAGVIAIALTSPALLSPAVVGAGSVAADIQTPGVPFLTPSVVGAGSVAVTLTTPARLSVAVVGAGTVSTTLASPALLSAAVGGAGVVVAALTSPALMTPTVAGAGSAAATLITPHLFVVAAVGTTTVTATLLSTPLLSPTVAGGATITTTITSAALLSPAVSGASMVAVTLSSPALMTVTISGVTTVTAAITVLLPGAPHIIHISGTDDTVTLVAGSDASTTALVGSLDAVQVVGSVSGPLSIVGSYDLILVIGDPDMATKTDVTLDIGADSAIVMTITGTGSIVGQTFRAGIANRGNPGFDVLDGVPVITDAPGRVVTWTLTDTQTLALVAGSQYTYAIWRADDASEAPLAYGQCVLRRLPGAS